MCSGAARKAPFICAELPQRTPYGGAYYNLAWNAETHLLLATLVAGALHGSIAPRRRRRAGVVAILVLLVARCRPLEPADARGARGRKGKGVVGGGPLRGTHGLIHDALRRPRNCGLEIIRVGVCTQPARGGEGSALRSAKRVCAQSQMDSYSPAHCLSRCRQLSTSNAMQSQSCVPPSGSLHEAADERAGRTTGLP